MMKKLLRKSQIVQVYLVFLLLFGAYTSTTSPDIVASANGGELTSAAVTLGIAHPTGYSTWTTIMHGAAKFMPLGNLAFRVNVTTSFLLLLALWISYLLFSTMLPHHHQILGLPFVTLLAMEPFVWREAISAEVYGFHLLLTLILGWTILTGFRTRNVHFYLLGYFVFGLSMTNHLLTIFNAPLLLIPLLQLRKRKAHLIRFILPAITISLVGFSVVLYLPLRLSASPALTWQCDSDLPGILAHITGAQFHGHLGTHEPGMTSIVGQIMDFLKNPFHCVVAFLGILGISSFLFRKRNLFTILGFLPFLAGVFVFPFTYSIHDIGSYFLVPIWLLFAGTTYLFTQIRYLRWLTGIPSTSLAIIIVISGWSMAHSELQQYQKPLLRTYGQSMLAGVLPGNQLEYQGDNPMNALSYLVICEKYSDSIRCIDLTGNLVPFGVTRNEWYPPSKISRTYRSVGEIEEFVPNGLVYNSHSKNKPSAYFTDLSQIILEFHSDKRSKWNPNMNELLAQMCINMSDHFLEYDNVDLGLKLANMALKIPNESSLPRYLASLLAARGEIRKAISINQSLIDKNTGDASSANNLAYYQFLLGDKLEDALESIQMARRIEPNNTGFLETEYELLLVLGELDQARDREAHYPNQISRSLIVQRRILDQLADSFKVNVTQWSCEDLTQEALDLLPRPSLNHHYRLLLQRKFLHCSADPETWHALIDVCKYMNLEQILIELKRSPPPNSY